MMDFFSKHGAAVMAGFLVGLALVVWVQPNSRGGQGLLMAICISVAVLLRVGGRLLARLMGR